MNEINEKIQLLKPRLDRYLALYYREEVVYRARRPMDDGCYEMAMPMEKSLDDVVKEVENTFQEQMFFYIDTKKLDEVEVYNKAHIDRRLFSKIRSNKDFRPSKKTAICICIGLKLSLDETRDLIGKAGYTLSHSSKGDLIVEFFIKNKDYDLDVLNQTLYEYKEPLLYL